MINSFFFIRPLLVLALAMTVLGRTKFREEDKALAQLPTLKVVSLSKPFIILTWFMVCLVSIILLILPQDPDIILPIGMIGIVATILCMVLGIVQRSSYYMDNGEQLIYVKQKQMVWCLKWTEIAHVYRHLVSRGKSVIALYDIVTTDGQIFSKQPAVLGRVLKKHVDIEKSHQVSFVVVLVMTILILLAVLLLTL